MKDFQFMTRVNKASPQLILACATAKHIKQAIFTARTSLQDFLVIKFTDLLISSYDIGGSEADPPLEQVSFNFAKIDYEFRPQRADGSLAKPIHVGWDLKLNKKV